MKTNSRLFVAVYWLGLVLYLTTACARFEQQPQPAYPGNTINHGNSSGNTPNYPVPEPDRIYIENSRIRLGIDRNAGGAITYLSTGRDSTNMINNFDLGRQLQSSLYSGPVPFSLPGNLPITVWSGLGWNPVQTGDYYSNSANLLEYKRIDDTRLYIKTIPLIWPLKNVVAECVMEHWIELRNDVVHFRSKTTVSRTDTTQHEARTQEAPCMYLNGPWFRAVTYTGNQPFTNAPTTEFETSFNIADRYATENWTALLNRDGRGVGIYRPNEYRYISAVIGLPGRGNENDSDCGYLTAAPFAVLDHNGVYEYECDLIVGDLARIRAFAYAQTRPQTVPNFRFQNSRQGWYYANTRDQGWPLPANELAIRWWPIDPTKPLRVASPTAFWRAEEVPKIVIEAAFTTPATTARLVWRQRDDDDWTVTVNRSTTFAIVGDGQLRRYEIPVAGVAGWEGIISQVALSPAAGAPATAGQWLRLRQVGVM
jgi:hypothetical protein